MNRSTRYYDKKDNKNPRHDHTANSQDISNLRYYINVPNLYPTIVEDDDKIFIAANVLEMTSSCGINNKNKTIEQQDDDFMKREMTEKNKTIEQDDDFMKREIGTQQKNGHRKKAPPSLQELPEERKLPARIFSPDDKLPPASSRNKWSDDDDNSSNVDENCLVKLLHDDDFIQEQTRILSDIHRRNAKPQTKERTKGHLDSSAGHEIMTSRSSATSTGVFCRLEAATRGTPTNNNDHSTKACGREKMAELSLVSDSTTEDMVAIVGAQTIIHVKGSRHTYECIANGQATFVQCPGCANIFRVGDSARFLFCPTCRQVSPVALSKCPGCDQQQHASSSSVEHGDTKADAKKKQGSKTSSQPFATSPTPK